MVEYREWKIEALTDIWTGDASQNGNRLIPTGIMGSLRWWFEVLVRGLGGKACDPTVQGVRCPNPNKKSTDPGHHCVVCELFGCTGWARKFRLMILDENDNVIQGRIKAGTKFVLRFIPLRHVKEEEWCLLDATLRLIAEYGAIGGKTVFKPSEEWGIADLGEADLENTENGVRVRRSRKELPLQQGDIIQAVDGQTINSIEGLRDVCASLPHGYRIKVRFIRNNESHEEEMWAGKRHHQDFGLIEIEKSSDNFSCERERLEAYVQDNRWHKQFDHSTFAWASLKNFWCVKGEYLARQGANISTFNAVVGRKQDKSVKERRGRKVIRWSDLLARRNDGVSRWLAGSQQESKKVFSFKNPKSAQRTFGFVKPSLLDFNGIQSRLKQVWGDLKDDEFLYGDLIIEKLFEGEE